MAKHNNNFYRFWVCAEEENVAHFIACADLSALR